MTTARPSVILQASSTEGGRDESDAVDACAAAVGGGAQGGYAARDRGRGVPGAAGRSAHLAARVSQTVGCRRGCGRARRADGAGAVRAGGGGVANCDHRRRHRGPDGGADPPGQGRLLRRVRVVRSRRRPDALRLGGVRDELLGERAAGRALRRADRQQPQDDPPARPALQARDGRPAPGAAERHRGHLLDLRRRLPVRQGDRRLQADPQHAAGPSAGDELPDAPRQPSTTGSRTTCPAATGPGWARS